MKLIPNWRRCHRMLSVQLWTLNGAGAFAWARLPDDLKAAIPHSLTTTVAIVMFILPIVARLIDQGDVTAPKADAPTTGDQP